jgi:nitrate/nitrite transport system ATP-binding protein
MSGAYIVAQGLTKRFADASGHGQLTVFEDMWFGVAEGEIACVIGHSGCGKSTILNILAGLDTPTEGHIIAAGKHVQGPSLDRAVIFQSHALMPWLSALGNVELAVSARHSGWSRGKIRDHAMKYLALVHLDGSYRKKPAQLSGGMKQRVGIARALAIEPRILLMDEPFSALDALTRGALQDELMAIRRSMRQTVFMITHDVDEALLLADRILLMTNGPNAWIAEIVENTLPRDRTRAELHRQPNYTPLRNHVIDFLLTRSRVLAATTPSPAARRAPPSVTPRAGIAAAPSEPASAQSRMCPSVGGVPRCAEAPRAVGCAPAQALAANVPRPGASWPVDRPFKTEQGEPTMRREQLTEKILDIKREKGLTWKQITDEIGGMSPVLVVGALLGQMKLVKPLARRAATLFGLSQAEERMLNEVPHRGTSMPPTDPLIYRFYELVMVNGPAWKALIEEEFGDGIMSAIDFDMEIERLPNPKGDRVKITMSGKFLPYKYYGSEQGILEYGVKEA